MHPFCRFLILVCILILTTTSLSAAAQQPPSSPKPSVNSTELLQLSKNILHDIELIRDFMGCPESGINIISVSNAEPREEYFQAVSLFAKVKRLQNYLMVPSEQKMSDEPETILPQDVRLVLELVAAQLQEIKHTYRIPVTARPDIDNNSNSPSDVYAILLRSIRQVNLMVLDHPYTPSDVFQEITAAFYYFLEVAKTVQGIRILPPPPLETGKTPADVFAEMVAMYRTIHNIYKDAGREVLDLTVSPAASIMPSDVFDMAVLIKSELRHLYKLRADSRPVHQSVYPGVKFPSQVYQRASHLHNHLRRFEKELITAVIRNQAS